MVSHTIPSAGHLARLRRLVADPETPPDEAATATVELAELCPVPARLGTPDEAAEHGGEHLILLGDGTRGVSPADIRAAAARLLPGVPVNEVEFVITAVLR